MWHSKVLRWKRKRRNDKNARLKKGETGGQFYSVEEMDLIKLEGHLLLALEYPPSGGGNK